MTNAIISTSSVVGSVVEGQYAVGEFTLTQELTDATTVGASLTVYSSSTDGAGPDCTGFDVHMGAVNINPDVWTPITLAAEGDTFVLSAGYTSFQLRTYVNTDHVQEFNDSIAFAVGRLTTSVGLEDSWYVENSINIAEPAVTPVMIKLDESNKSTVDNVTVNETKVDEGHAAIALFNLTGSGTHGIATNPYSVDGLTLVNVSVAGSGATAPNNPGSDFGNLYYRTSATGSFSGEGLNTNGDGLGSAWTPIDAAGALSGQISLAAGEIAFELGVFVNVDHKTEYQEAVTFVASQTAGSNTIQDSWWVSGTVNLIDPGAVDSAAPITPVVIELASATNTNVDEGQDAVAKFVFTDGTDHSTLRSLDGLSSDASDNTWLNVSVAGSGATPDTSTVTGDFGGLQYRSSSDATWHDVPTDGDHKGQISLAKGTTSFELGVVTHTDNITEYKEAVTFAVSQAADSNTLKDSWWVSGTVNLIDPGAAGSLHPVTPVVIELASATETKADEGQDAVAKFIFTDGHGTTTSLDGLSSNISDNTWLDVSVTGLGATPDTSTATGDFGGLQYKASGDSVWQDAPTSGEHKGQISLAKDTTSFELKVATHVDTVTEYGEAVAFVVGQTADSMTVKDSWYVAVAVNLVDAGSSDGQTFVGAVGADLFTGTNNADIFVIPEGTSLARAGQFDTITGLGADDKIDLGLLDVIPASRIIIHDFVDEAAVLTQISDSQTNGGMGGYDAAGFNVGSDFYLFVDTNNKVDLASDVFVKIVGANLSAEQISGYLV